MIFGCKWFHHAVALFVTESSMFWGQTTWLDAIWRKKGVNADKPWHPFWWQTHGLICLMGLIWSRFQGPFVQPGVCDASVSLCVFGTRHALSQIMLLMAKSTIGIHLTFQKRPNHVIHKPVHSTEKKLIIEIMHSHFLSDSIVTRKFCDRTEHINSSREHVK